jgi:hypothetical protein
MEALPNELILEIFAYLSKTDVCDLLNISLTNRRLYRLAKELIYRTFSWDHGDPALFIRALAASPGLEECVHDVNWDNRRWNSYKLVTSDAFQFGEDFTPAERQYIEGKLGFGSSLGMTGLNRRFGFLGEHSYLDTFLLFIPKLKTIEIAIPTKWDHHAIWFKQALDSQVFAQLNKAHIIGPMRIQNVLPLFLVPSLRSLKLSNVMADRNLVRPGVRFEWKRNHEFFQRLEREGSSVEHFQFHGNFIYSVDIVPILKAFRDLKTFSYETGSSVMFSEIPSMLQGITHQYSSLTSVSLKNCCTGEDLTKLELLKDLEHLKVLELDITETWDGIIGPEELGTFLRHLPGQLEELNLQVLDGDGEDNAPTTHFIHALKAVAPTINSVLPALKKLVISGWDPLLGTFTCQTQVKALQLGFAKAGVELVSRPDTPNHMPGDDDGYREMSLYALDYVEEDWAWVQWIWCGDWTHDQNALPVNDWTVTSLVSDEEDWVMLHRMDLLREHPVDQRMGWDACIPAYPEWHPEQQGRYEFYGCVQ